MNKMPVFWILKQIRTRIPAIALMTLAQVGHSLLCVCFALGSRGVIDSAVAGEPAAFFRSCGIQAGIIGGIIITLAMVRHLRDRLSADLERDWKRRLLHGLLHGDYSNVAAYHSGELLNRLNNDVAKVNDGILSIFPSAAAMVTRLIAAIAVLGVLDIRFTALVLALGLTVILSTGLMRRRLKELNKLVSQHDGRVSGFLQEIMEKLLMVQAMDVSQEVEARADQLLSDRYAVQRRRKNISLMTNTGISFLSYGAGFLALCWCAWQLLMGQMSFGSLTAVIQLVNQLQAPFVNLSGVLPQYAAMTASAERLMELEAIQGEPAPHGENPHSLYRRMEAIRAENLIFSYDRDTVLQDTAFSLPKGAFAVITGPSGIGKSTLLKLLLGIFRPESGSLYLAASEEKNPPEPQHTAAVCLCPQGNLLLSGTRRENLTIVRAVLGGAPILLLDECTSALDAETEKTVLTRLHSLPDRTCIAVTHRSAALTFCDWQMDIREGRIFVFSSSESTQ